MSNSVISVIIATYNYAHYLPIALKSVCAQSFSDWEVVIVDDGSTDNTPEVVEPFLHDTRIKYIRGSNAGQPAAENRGIRAATGRFIAFLDADDYWLPTKLARQLEAFQRAPHAGVVYTGRTTIDPHGRKVMARTSPLYRGRIFTRMFRDNFICFSSSIVRREVFDEVGLFNEECRHASDYDLWLRVAPRWDFEFVDEPLVCYRTGHANLTSRKDVQLLTALSIMDRHGQTGSEELPDAWRRLAYAETFCHLGLAYRDSSRLSALRAYLNAIWFAPLYYGGWRGIFALGLPNCARRWARRLLGRPIEWQTVTYSE